MSQLAITTSLVLSLLLVGCLILLWRQNKALLAARQEAHERRNELLHAGRLAAVGQLSASIAHEINQPLGAILSNADAAELLLKQAHPPLDELQQIMADIRADDLRAHEVIRRLRSLLEKRESELLEIDLRAPLHDVARVLAAEAQRRHIDLQVHPGPKALMVQGDAVQLEQIVLNLALNAMDAVAEQPARSRQVSIVIDQAQTSIDVSVLDSGPGIPADAAARIFDSFYTTKPNGLGLGLSIARSIAQTHGGSLSAMTRAEGGAAVTLRLPRRELDARKVPDQLTRQFAGAKASWQLRP
jgi:C4-dicarboxylate-specific signal transduction histidine kinase